MNKKAINKAVTFLESWLAYRARHVDIPGFSVAVYADDKIIFSKAYGLADTAQQTPLTPGHLFHMASQTKMLTATAIMQLVEDAKLALDAPASRFLIWLHSHPDQRVHQITIRQLLCHASGLSRDGLASDHWLGVKPAPTGAQMQKMVLETDLAFSPGGGVKYSNLGYALLAQIVRTVSGMPYEQYVQSRAIGPLGLNSMTLSPTRIRNHMPAGYGVPFEHKRPPLKQSLSAGGLLGVVGLYATPEAMCQFVSHFFDKNSALLGSDLKREMQKTHSNISEGYDVGVEFALGYEIQELGGRRLLGHTGHVAGHVSATFFDPKRRIAVSVAANSRDAPTTAMARGVFGAIDFFLKTKATVSNDSEPFALRLRNDMASVEIVQHGDTIIAIDPDDWEPFAWYETLEQVSPTMLRVTTQGSVYNQGEPVSYIIKDNKVAKVYFAGMPFWPEMAK